MENEQADAGREGRTRLTEIKFSGANGDGEKSCFPVQLNTSRIANHVGLIPALLHVAAESVWLGGSALALTSSGENLPV